MTSEQSIETVSVPERKTGDPLVRFDALVHALTIDIAEGGLPEGVIVTESLNESDLGERTFIAPDGVSLLATGDNTLKSKDIITVNLSALAKSRNTEADNSFEAILAGAVEELSLDPDLANKAKDQIRRMQQDGESKAEFLRTKEATGYARGAWRDWSDPSLRIIRTTKKDGTVLMGALLGATTTTHVSLGGDRRVDDPSRSGLQDTDDLWQDGMQKNYNVKVPLDVALSWTEQLTLDQVQASAV